jgi:hypothetical protein
MVWARVDLMAQAESYSVTSSKPVILRGDGIN